MTRRGVIASALAVGGLLSATYGSAAEQRARPNLLLIVADDLGYGDLGVYGGDIRTPHIDALAADGLLFTQFHTAASCAPTRAMLLSGNNNHVAGMGQQGVRRAIPGYENHLSDRIAPLPRLLREAGYRTFTVGKWHLGEADANSPKAAGFERSVNLLAGAGNHFDGVGFDGDRSSYREVGKLVEWPEGRYSTDLYTDRLIEFIDSSNDLFDTRRSVVFCSLDVSVKHRC